MLLELSWKVYEYISFEYIRVIIRPTNSLTHSLTEGLQATGAFVTSWLIHLLETSSFNDSMLQDISWNVSGYSAACLYQIMKFFFQFCIMFLRGFFLIWFPFYSFLQVQCLVTSVNSGWMLGMLIVSKPKWICSCPKSLLWCILQAWRGSGWLELCMCNSDCTKYCTCASCAIFT
jgi:hypothetical protein